MRQTLYRATLAALLVLAVAASADAAKRALIVTDGAVGPASDAIRNELRSRGFEVVVSSVVPGDLSSFCCAWDLRIDQPHRIEHAGDADRGELAGQRRLGPARRHERLGGEVVDLGRARLAQWLDQRALVEQVRLMERDVLFKMTDSFTVIGAGSAVHAMHLIALL